MSAKVTRKEIRSSDRTKECEIFRSILRNETLLRGLVLHSNNQGGTGKTTLLKMFENDCQTLEFDQLTIALYFTAKRPLSWKMLLDATVDRLGSQNFNSYTQLREAYSGSSKETVKTQPNMTYITNINNIKGPVHTGSGDIKTTLASPAQVARPIEDSSSKLALSQEDIVSSLTQTFLQDLKSMPKPLQVIWLVDTVEKLDELNQAWLIDLFQQIVDGNVYNLILVVAGRELLCYEPYWIDKVEELHIGYFDENVVLEIVRKIWPTEHPALLKGMAQLLMRESGGRPMELIMQIESFNPYD